MKHLFNTPWALLITGLLILTACGGEESTTSNSSQTSSLTSSLASQSSEASSSVTSTHSESSNSVSSSQASSSTNIEAWMEPALPNFNPAVIENGVQLFDTNGEALHAHGAGVIKVGEYYYWYGENRFEDQSFKSVRLYRSKNLNDWEFVNDILTNNSDPDLNYAKIERPKIIYNALNDQYVMWMHKEGGDNYSQARAAVAVSNTIGGDYQYLGSFRPLNHMSRDCTAFVDDDGTGYFLSAANENADLHLYQLSSDFTQIDHLVQKIWVGQHREAPALVKRNGVYFLITSGTSGWDPNQARYGTATDIRGNWSSTQALGNDTTFDSQPTFILTVSGSEDTSYLYMGDRWLDPEYKDSKYVWLPLEFPTSNSVSLNWNTRIAVDTQTGELLGSGTEEVRIRSIHSDRCLDVSDESLDERANIIQWGCTAKHNQKWRLTQNDEGYFQIKALHSSQCLDVASGSSEDGANILQWPCNGETNQQWQVQSNDDETISFISRETGKCLDIEEWSSENGGNIQQWECTGRANQKWFFN